MILESIPVTLPRTFWVSIYLGVHLSRGRGSGMPLAEIGDGLLGQSYFCTTVDDINLHYLNDPKLWGLWYFLLFMGSAGFISSTVSF